MPIEIRELVIRASVGAAPAAPASGPMPPQLLEQLVQECVRQVLQRLADAQQR